MRHFSVTLLQWALINWAYRTFFIHFTTVGASGRVWAHLGVCGRVWAHISGSHYISWFVMFCTRIMFYKERSKVMYSCQFWFLYSRSLICTLLFVQSFLKLKFRFSRSFKEFFFINMFIRKNLHYIYSLLKTGNITNYNRIIIRRIKCIFSYILAIFL